MYIYIHPTHGYYGRYARRIGKKKQGSKVFLHVFTTAYPFNETRLFCFVLANRVVILLNILLTFLPEDNNTTKLEKKESTNDWLTQENNTAYS